MRDYDYKRKMNQNRKRWMKRVAGVSVATSLVLAPVAPNVLSNVGLQSAIGTSVAYAATENIMGIDRSGWINGYYNEHYDHTRYVMYNDADTGIKIYAEDYHALTYIVKFPEELSYILDDPFFQENLIHASNAGEFMMTGEVVDEAGEEYAVSRADHAPANYVSVNKETNSIEFDLYKFLKENGFVSLQYFGFSVPIYQQGYFPIPNGEYTFKTALVAADQADLDQVSNTNHIVLTEEEGEDSEEPKDPEDPEEPGDDEPGDDDSDDSGEEPGDDDSDDVGEEPGDDDSDDDGEEPGDDDSDDAVEEPGDDDSDDAGEEPGDDDSDDVVEEPGDDNSNDAEEKPGDDDSDDDDKDEQAYDDDVIVLDLDNMDSVELQPELLQLLKDGHVLVLTKDGVELEITGAIFDNFEDPVTVSIVEQETAEGSLSKTYDLEIVQAGESLSDFGDETVTLTFDVDEDRAKNTDNLKIFYYNENKEAWELVGGKYSDGKVSAETNHLSTFTVFETEVKEPEKEEVENDVLVTEKDKKDDGKSDEAINKAVIAASDSSKEQGDTLPDTATNIWAFGLAGALAVASGFTLKLANRFRRGN